MHRHGLVAPIVALLFAACSGGASTTTGGAAQDLPPKPPGESPASQQKEKDPSTQIVVGIDAEDFRSQGYVMSEIDVTARVAGVVAADEKLDAKDKSPLPHELVLSAPKTDPNALVEIVVVAKDGGAGPSDGRPPILTRTATAKFVPGKKKLAYVFLEVRCNTYPMGGLGALTGPTCTNPAETCIGGACRANALGDMPDYAGDWQKNPPSHCGAGNAPTIDLAKGEKDATPLGPDETLQMETGPQCGHHVWLGARMKDIRQQGAITTLSATQPGTNLSVPATAFPYSYSPSADGACELAGLRFQLDAAGASAQDFLGKPLDIKIEAKDKAGRTATVTKRVNIAPTMKGDFPYCNGGGPRG